MWNPSFPKLKNEWQVNELSQNPLDHVVFVCE
jgi:hypothetical protein